MALSDRLASPPQPIHGTPCSVAVLLDKLDDADRDALLRMLGTPEQRGWSQDAIYDAVIAEGHEIGRQSINRHRGGKCRCRKASA